MTPLQLFRVLVNLIFAIIQHASPSNFADKMAQDQRSPLFPLAENVPPQNGAAIILCFHNLDQSALVSTSLASWSKQCPILGKVSLWPAEACCKPPFAWSFISFLLVRCFKTVFTLQFGCVLLLNVWLHSAMCGGECTTESLKLLQASFGAPSPHSNT